MGANLPELRVLVIDDERNIRSTLVMCLQASGCQATAVESARAAEEAVERGRFELAFLDLRLGTESGLDLLPRLLEKSPGLEVVMITAYGTIDTAVQALQKGARDFITKPFTPAQIRHVVERSRERRALVGEVARLSSALADAAPELSLESRAPVMQQVLERMEKAAAHDVPVLLLGESGTGKGVLARAIHERSPRRDKPFVVVNCPTLSEELLASELFGHAKGAFTGAVRDQPGKVESADGGTLFLDELGELPTPLQAKLLRFLQDRQFERVGETQTRVADVRVVAATNRNLEAEVKAGRFREDLFFRLNTVELALPPLRERTEDLLELARRDLHFLARSMRRHEPKMSPAFEQALLAYRWPGNLRELHNALERAMIFSAGEVLTPEGLPERMTSATPAGPALGGSFTLEEIERAHLERVLARAGSVDEAARILGIDPSTIWRKRKRYEESK